MLLSVFLPGWTWLSSYLHAFHFKPSIIILSVVWYNKNAYLSTQGQRNYTSCRILQKCHVIGSFQILWVIVKCDPFFRGQWGKFLSSMWTSLANVVVWFKPWTRVTRSCFSFYRKTSKLENVERHLERGSFRHLPRLPDTDNIKQKNKNNETILSRFFPEQKTKRSFVLRHPCPIREVLTLFLSIPKPTLISWA